MRVLSSRKAGVELTSENLVGLILAAVAIVGLVALLIALISIFSGEAHGGSRTTLTKVYEGVNALYHDSTTETGCYIPGIFIEPDWAVVGFNADGVSNANNRFACEMGENCIQEQCGVRDQTLVKPRACGRGPCVCLCDGGTGDISGEDCIASTAICRRFTSTIGFEKWYLPYPADECVTRVPGVQGSACDLVMYGEHCGGTDRDVQFDIVIKKVGEDALVVDQVTSSVRRSTYAEFNVPCKTIVERINRPEKKATTTEESETPEAPKGPTTADTLREAGAHSVTIRRS